MSPMQAVVVSFEARNEGQRGRLKQAIGAVWQRAVLEQGGVVAEEHACSSPDYSRLSCEVALLVVLAAARNSSVVVASAEPAALQQVQQHACSSAGTLVSAAGETARLQAPGWVRRPV